MRIVHRIHFSYPLSVQNVSGELTGTGVELQTFSDKEWEKGETALSTQLLKAKKDKKGVSVFSAGTGPRRKGSYSAESEERKELQLKVNLIAQYVSDVAKLLMDDVIGREGVEVRVLVRNSWALVDPVKGHTPLHTLKG
ncbi:unnamed protein product [Haemonchus placei]|uniref:IMS_C domain-containing protein n=1 Tax=Haemonchus placei TaxID=6290 RepID=A0A0N4WK88_HAEPC|nr:unnamed protein product [Haemonchus placei]